MPIAHLASASERADQFTLQSFLNCYLREYAKPKNLLTFTQNPQKNNWPLSLHQQWNQCAGYTLTINLPVQQKKILLKTVSTKLLSSTRCTFWFGVY